MAVVIHPGAWLERRRARRRADYRIAHGLESRYPWRVAELTSTRERKACARALAGVIGELTGEKLPGAAPLRRAALRPHLARFEQLRRRLLDDEPVTGIGMLAVSTLLASPDSCLFSAVDDVDDRLRVVLERLDMR
jgi:hypothetical protein